ncbi:MlaC/ttg2D family ABC transporter substrate-binding protein [Pseudidiomarina terrestris]|uniref:ABC transporter substrate-binding protein n=1 Tax=Pseudidiomarina terrestris TaxID=2820060 RepID=A0ABT8MHJ8_9GAMM|nr:MULTISPECIES: ABC transporter substrate-binding protein [unclassified Pseudidiomarina]MDN7129405.1 ABC transporter substrate-binding protein [Pseudidiomarina sp. 1APR75-15]MDN7134330.1 ABC transporter substrate-binding protein [Pseudidiomarina sp. 1ASP75-5]MDN7136982.1 ABC transporter substrate-binding protein [Pseudidiomarina sp. 1ASP75-14]MEA3587876.1 ABC transporter substrate-binding protein [Pseudidiomarina sp. 1APP75-27a]
MKIWYAFLMAALLVVTGTAVANTKQDAESPYVLLERVANKTAKRISEERAKINEDLDYLRVIIREELMPYVDATYAAKRVLGRNLKDTTEQQRQEFYSVFREYLIATYGRAFTQYDEEKHEFQFERARDIAPDDRMVEVKTRLIEKDGRPPVRLDFKLRYDDDEKVWKAYDLVVEGVSLLNSKAAEISSVIRDRGIDGTIELLREKGQEPIQPYDQGNS